MNNKPMIAALLAMAGLVSVANAEPPAPVQHLQGHAVYGEPMSSGAAPTPLAEVLMEYQSNPSAAPVVVSGKITEVCQKKGCWMMLTDAGVGARVRFGDHAFAIPKDSSGKAIVLGSLRAVEMSERDAKHMAADAGKDPSTVRGPQQEWELMASSVQIIADH